MQVDESFWLEMERRLKPSFDNINYRLDKMDNRLDKVDNRLDKVDNRLDKMHESVINVINWTKRQDYCIEAEINHALKKHLVQVKYGFLTLKNPSRFPKKICDRNGEEITEFDGIVVLTDSPEFSKYLAGKASKDTVNNKDTINAYIIVVEAKQNLTLAKLKTKIKQRNSIMQLLKFYKQHPSRMPSDLENIMFDRFSLTVGLYIGGQDIDHRVLSKMERFLETPDYVPDLVFVQGKNNSSANSADEMTFDIFAEQVKNNANKDLQIIASIQRSGIERMNVPNNNDSNNNDDDALSLPTVTAKDLCGIIALTGIRFNVVDNTAEHVPEPFAGFRGGMKQQRANLARSHK